MFSIDFHRSVGFVRLEDCLTEGLQIMNSRVATVLAPCILAISLVFGNVARGDDAAVEAKLFIEDLPTRRSNPWPRSASIPPSVASGSAR